MTLATAPRDAVYADGRVTLYRYRSEQRRARLPPLLIVFALVNRPTVLDLQPDRSLIRGLLAGGLDVYLLDWGYPDRSDRHTTLADYTTGYLHRAVEHIGAKHGPINLLGVCQGGTLALMYASLEPVRIAKLVTMVTPVDFQTPDNLLSKWVRGVDVDRLVDTFGNAPGELLNATFLALMPFRLTMQKYLALVDGAGDTRQLESFLCAWKKWIFEQPGPGRRQAFREFLKWFYGQENRLIQGTVTLGGRGVDLGRISMPVLNIYATADDSACRRWRRRRSAARSARGAIANSPSTAATSGFMSARGLERCRRRPSPTGSWRADARTARRPAGRASRRVKRGRGRFIFMLKKQIVTSFRRSSKRPSLVQ